MVNLDVDLPPTLADDGVFCLVTLRGVSVATSSAPSCVLGPAGGLLLLREAWELRDRLSSSKSEMLSSLFSISPSAASISVDQGSKIKHYIPNILHT